MIDTISSVIMSSLLLGAHYSFLNRLSKKVSLSVLLVRLGIVAFLIYSEIFVWF